MPLQYCVKIIVVVVVVAVVVIVIINKNENRNCMRSLNTHNDPSDSLPSIV